MSQILAGLSKRPANIAHANLSDNLVEFEAFSLSGGIGKKGVYDVASTMGPRVSRNEGVRREPRVRDGRPGVPTA